MFITVFIYNFFLYNRNKRSIKERKKETIMKKIKRIAALASVFMLTTVTNIFAETGVKPAPKVKFSEIVLGVGVGLFVAYGFKAFRKGKNTKSGMYDNKGAKVPPMQTKKKKKKKK